MKLFALIAFCVYSGVRNACSGTDVMVVDDRIVTIPEREFYGWTSLVNVSFSSNSELTLIGKYAFYGCTRLETITFPPKLETMEHYAFTSCRSLPAIHLPPSLSSIGAYVFAQCTKVTSVTADEGIQVTALDNYAFSNTNITTFAIWKSLTTIAAGAFSNCMHFSTFTNPFGNPVFNVIDGLLYKGTALNMMPVQITGHFVIPANVTSIIHDACAGIQVESLSFGSGSQLKTFGTSCFYTAEFTTFTFPDTGLYTIIPLQMFRGCANLETIVIPDCVKTIGTTVFYRSGMAYIDVAPGNLYFASIDGVLFSKDLQTLVACPPCLDTDKYVIPKEVTSIAATAFYRSNIANIEFESGSQLNSLGTFAFAEIGQSTFIFDFDCPLAIIPANCFQISKLISIQVPRKLQSIDGSAFSSTKLSEFVIPADSEYLISLDGVLFSKNETILYRFPPAKLGHYDVPSSVEVIGTSSFATCSGIPSLSFASDSRLQEVKASAFTSSSITSVVFGDNSDDVVFESGCFSSSSIQYVTLPGKMRVIGKDLFNDCPNLVGIVLPETATSIETGAFNNCPSLERVSIPKFCGIRNIPSGAFSATFALKSLELPYLVDTIAAGSLPSGLEKVVLWCPLTPSVVDAIRIIPTLQEIYILCDANLDTSSFVARDVIVVHHVCSTKQLRLKRIGKPHLVMTVLFLNCS